MIINLDSDGVVYNLSGILTARTEKRLGRSLPAAQGFGLSNWELTREEVDRIFEVEAQNGIFRFGEAIEGAVDGVLRLADNHQVRIVTNKSSKALGRGSITAMQDTIQWYKGVGLLDKVEMVFTDGYGKQGYPANIVIDDQPNLEWVQEDAANILFDRTWNHKVTGKAKGPWLRALSWDEVVHLVDIEQEEGQGWLKQI